MAKKRPVAQKPAKKKAAAKTTRVAVRGRTASSKTGAKKRRAAKKGPRPQASEPRSPEVSTLDGRMFATGPGRPRRGRGSGAAGQSGDLQGLSRNADVDSESVEELAEEGQAFEAEVVSGVEDALDPDQGEVRTREIPADDVPEEYTDED